MDRHSEPLSLPYTIAALAILSALIMLAFHFGPMVSM